MAKTIRLCGDLVLAPGTRGPTNGMFALQLALAERKCEWLKVGGDPEPDEIAWWWCNRTKAVEWELLGRPSIHGPNMTFINSWSPRFDTLECQLLDAKHCLAMVCHGEPYKRLLSAHLGSENRAKFILMPYPVYPPLPQPSQTIQYDLLLYLKSGYSNNTIDRLQKQFPQNYKALYGSYDRSELMTAASTSRMGIYFSDDDSGGIALSEILLAGCPCLGMPLMGFITAQCGMHIPNLTFESCMSGLKHLQKFERHAVSQYAMTQFSGEAVVDTLLTELNQLR